jgi:hypothetical protein
MSPRSQESDDQRVFDATPYLRLEIDREGRWFQNGAEIIHPEIYRAFNEMLERAPDGGYQVRMGREICRVQVEDTPFVVQRIVQDARSLIMLELNDGTREVFRPDRFWIGDHNIPYTKVKGDSFHARFSRPAYYQLAQHIMSDESESRFFFVIEGKEWPIVQRRSDMDE